LKKAEEGRKDTRRHHQWSACP